MNMLKLPQLTLAANKGSEKFGTFRINVKQSQISDVSGGHTKADSCQKGSAEF
jgi:hypothetical protein